MKEPTIKVPCEHCGKESTFGWTEVLADVLRAAACACHGMAADKGFWDEDRNFGELMALFHSEISEALEGQRHGNPDSEKLGAEFTQVEEEIADLVIRVLDATKGLGWRLGDAVVAKFQYNAGRARKHGKEF